MSVTNGRAQDRTPASARRNLRGEANTLSPGAAIAVLAEAAARAADTAERDEAADVLASALTQHPDAQVRVAAAAALGDIPSGRGVAPLRAAVDTTGDGQLLAAASLALARAGDATDLDRLERASRRVQGAAGRPWTQAAMRLLAHRTHLVVDQLRDRAPLVAERERLLPPPRQGVAVRPIDPGEMDGVRPGRRGEAFVPAGSEPLAGFSCGPRRHIVLAPPGVDHVRALLEAPSIAAALVGVNETTGLAFVRWLVLTEPVGDGQLLVTVARPTGEAGFTGRGHVDGDAARLQVRSLALPGASALQLDAVLRPGSLTVSGLGDPAVTVPRRVPAPAPASA